MILLSRQLSLYPPFHFTNGKHGVYPPDIFDSRLPGETPGLYRPDLAHAFSLISRLRLQDNVLHKHKSFPFFAREAPIPRVAPTPTGRYMPRSKISPPRVHPFPIYSRYVNWHQIFPRKNVTCERI